MSRGVREHIKILINSLANLSPSRNVISQMILLLPRDAPTIEHSYPELATPEGREILETLGVSFGETVERADGFSKQLFFIVHKVFDWLLDDEVRSALAKLTGESVDSVPNPYEEWVKAVLKKLLERPVGKKVVEFLLELLNRQTFIVEREGYSKGAAQPNWKPFLEEVREKLKVDPAEFREILKIAVGDSPEPVGRIREGRSSGYEYVVHSEYHFDLIIKKQWWTTTAYHTWYDCHYVVRDDRGKVVRRVLNEVSK